MQVHAYADGLVAALLSRIPAYQRWSNQPLDESTRRLLRQADDQQLMSIVAEALVQLERREIGREGAGAPVTRQDHHSDEPARPAPRGRGG